MDEAVQPEPPAQQPNEQPTPAKARTAASHRRRAGARRDRRARGLVDRRRDGATHRSRRERFPSPRPVPPGDRAPVDDVGARRRRAAGHRRRRRSRRHRRDAATDAGPDGTTPPLRRRCRADHDAGVPRRPPPGDGTTTLPTPTDPTSSGGWCRTRRVRPFLTTPSRPRRDRPAAGDGRHDVAVPGRPPRSARPCRWTCRWWSTAGGSATGGASHRAISAAATRPASASASATTATRSRTGGTSTSPWTRRATSRRRGDRVGAARLDRGSPTTTATRCARSASPPSVSRYFEVYVYTAAPIAPGGGDGADRGRRPGRRDRGCVR